MLGHRRVVAMALGCLVLNVGGCAHAVQTRSSEGPIEVAVLRESLRDAFMAQEIYYSHPNNKYTYASDPARLDQYHARPGIVITIFEGTAQGWSGMARAASGNACVIYVGKVSTVPRTPRGATAARASIGRDIDIGCDAPSPE